MFYERVMSVCSHAHNVWGDLADEWAICLHIARRAAHAPGRRAASLARAAEIRRAMARR